MATNSEAAAPDRSARPADARGRRAAAVLGLLLAAGCSPPQVESEHRELVLRLATATSTRDPDLLEKAAAEVDRLRDEGGLPDAEASAFDAIIAAGRSGDWERARRRAYDLRDAQRPTEADLERVRARSLPPPKTLPPPGAAR